MAEPARKIYPKDRFDNSSSETPVTGPDLKVLPGGGETVPRKQGHLKAVDSKNEAKEASTESSGGHGESDETGTTDTDSDTQSTQDSDSKGAGWVNSTHKHDADKKAHKKGRLRNMSTRKKLFGGGITGLLLGISIFGISTILQGPAQFIHFAQLLQKFHFSNNEEFANGRTGRYLRHYRKFGPGDAARSTKLTAVGNKAADRFEARMQQKSGLRTVYDTRTGRAVGFEVIDPSKATNFFYATDIDPNTDFGQHVPGQPDYDINTKYMTAGGRVKTSGVVFTMRDHDLGVRRRTMRAIVKGTSTSKIAGTIASRLLIKRAGVDFHPMNKLRRGDEKLIDFIRRIKSRRALEDRKGALPEDRANLNKDGDAESEKAQQQAKELQDTADVDPDATKASLKKKLAVGVGGVSAVIGVFCTARSVSKNVDKIQYANVILPLMRVGVRVITTGNQVMDGDDVTTDELGALNTDLYDAKTQLGWPAAKSIQGELGQKQSGPDISPTSKPASVGNNPFLNMVDAIFDKLGGAGGTACSTIGQWTLNVLEVGVGIFSGGTSVVVEAAIEGAISVGASAAGVSPTDIFIDWLTDKLAGNEVNVNAKGPFLGGLANYGARLAANDTAIAMGGAQLTKAEEISLNVESEAIAQNELRQKSLFARVFDLNEPDSLAAKSLLENNNLASLQAAFTSPLSLIKNMLPNLGDMMSSIFTPKVAALAVNYDYGFPEYGYSLSEQNNPAVEDPFDNAVIVEPRLEELNNKYGECFSMTIEPSTGALVNGEAINYFKESYDSALCNNKSDNDLFRYRFYMADMVTARSLACYEGDNASCNQLGFSSSATTTDTSDPGGGKSTATSCSLPRAQLVSQILAHESDGLLKFQNVGPQKSDLQNPAKTTDRLICMVWSILEQGGFPIVISAVNSDHTPGSLHGAGQAVDLAGTVASKPDQPALFKWLYDNHSVLQINELIFTPLPAGTTYLDEGKDCPSACYGSPSDPKSTVSAHDDHIHAGVLP